MKSRMIQRVCLATGACLLICAMIALVCWISNINSSEKHAEDYVKTLQSLMPSPQNAVPEERRDNTMPAVSIDGKGFIGIIEMPRFNSALPVGGDWGSSSKHPCRFSGSIYDRTIQIGATTQKGQYDFYRDLSIGDTLIFTDMEGNRFTYEINAMRYEKHADPSLLATADADFVLFIKNIYAFDYLIVYCSSVN